MVYIKKFYDTATTESGGGTESAVLEQPKTEIKETPKESFAEAMAKGGFRSTDSKAEKPIVNTEKKEEPKAVESEVKKVDTTTPSNEAKANSESLPPTEKKEEAEVKPIAQSATTEKSWQEVLKGQQPNNVLKELGFDDKTVQLIQDLNKFEKKEFFYNLFNEWKNKGDLKSYLNELSTDYTKMQPEEVMRHQLREEYPKASEKQLDALFKNEVVKAYNLDSEDPDEVEEGKMLLEAKADKYRDTLVERQQTRLFPQVPEPPPIEPDNSAQEAEQKFEAYKSTINKDPYSEKVFEKKQIVIGKGEDKWVMPVDPDALKNIILTDDGWNSTINNIDKNADGTVKSVTPKVKEQILIAAFAQNPEKFINDLAQHYLSIGGKKAIEPIDNAKQPDTVTMPNSVTQPNSLVEGMAKGGRKVSGVM